MTRDKGLHYMFESTSGLRQKCCIASASCWIFLEIWRIAKINRNQGLHYIIEKTSGLQQHVRAGAVSGLDFTPNMADCKHGAVRGATLYFRKDAGPEAKVSYCSCFWVGLSSKYGRLQKLARYKGLHYICERISDLPRTGRFCAFPSFDFHWNKVGCRNDLEPGATLYFRTDFGPAADASRRRCPRVGSFLKYGGLRK